jgi:hypothetical protein
MSNRAARNAAVLEVVCGLDVACSFGQMGVPVFG